MRLAFTTGSGDTYTTPDGKTWRHLKAHGDYGPLSGQAHPTRDLAAEGWVLGYQIYANPAAITVTTQAFIIAALE
jgi:hypothetical protein